MDDTWAVGRDGNGVLIANETKFPTKIPALAAYVHGKGLRFGICAFHTSTHPFCIPPPTHTHSLAPRGTLPSRCRTFTTPSPMYRLPTNAPAEWPADTDVGHKTCAKAPGTWGHEEVDANTFARWGVDFVRCLLAPARVGVGTRSMYPSL